MGAAAWALRTAHTHGTAAQLAAHSRTARTHTDCTHTRCKHTHTLHTHAAHTRAAHTRCPHTLQAAAFATYDLVMLDEAHDCTACQVGQSQSDSDSYSDSYSDSVSG